MSAAELHRQHPEFPDGLRSRAFRAVERVLREAPGLALGVKTWSTLEGVDTDMGVVGVDMCPLVALSPSPRPDRKLTGEHASVNFLVYVEVYARGSCVNDILNIWDAVGEAMRHDRPYRDGDVQSYFRCGIEAEPGQPPLSVLDVNLIEPAFIAWTPSVKSGDPAIQWGRGTIGLYFQRPR